MFINTLNEQTFPEEPIFPLVTYNPKTKIWKCVGTGFFINPFGIFVTAKHVVLNNDGINYKTLYGVQTTSKKEIHLRPVQSLGLHEEADISVGFLGNRRLHGGENVKAEIATSFSLNLGKLEIGNVVRTFAFPQTKRDDSEYGKVEFTFEGKWSVGEIVEYLPEGSLIVRNKCYKTTMDIDDGASGGPVLKNNLVVGVNSCGIELNEGESPKAIITPIDYILDLEVRLEGRLISTKELIEMGDISVKD